MEISEITRLFREKAAELQRFFEITPRPDVVYEDSFQFARALEVAADLLEEEPHLLESKVKERPLDGIVHQVLIEWHGKRIFAETLIQKERFVR